MRKKPFERVMHFRITEEENQELIFLARSFGLENRSRILRKMIREAMGQGPDLLRDDLNAFREAVRQLAALGRNINQIAHAINSGKAIFSSLDSQQLGYIGPQVESVRKEISSVVIRTWNRWVIAR